MDANEINKIREMMEEVHKVYFPKVVAFKRECKFPFELLEDDLIVKIVNMKNQKNINSSNF